MYVCSAKKYKEKVAPFLPWQIVQRRTQPPEALHHTQLAIRSIVLSNYSIATSSFGNSSKKHEIGR